MPAANVPSFDADESYEVSLLAQAFRALLSQESLDQLLCELAEAARVHTNCEHVVIERTRGAADRGLRLHGPWASSGAEYRAESLPSLELPVVVDGFSSHAIKFFKRRSPDRFSRTELDHARRLGDLAGLVLQGGASLRESSPRRLEPDHEPAEPARQDFEDAVLAALESQHGKAALLIARVSDLDQVNRRHGREVGDEVLRLVARSMREVIGSAGTVGRVRRHEFGAVLPGEDFARASERAKALDKLFANPQPVLGRDDVDATIAVGVAAAVDGDPGSVAPIFHAAYQALERELAELKRRPRASRWWT
jgi:diguanylate cyclase (GGDEF)-like protein